MEIINRDEMMKTKDKFNSIVKKHAFLIIGLGSGAVGALAISTSNNVLLGVAALIGEVSCASYRVIKTHDFATKSMDDVMEDKLINMENNDNSLEKSNNEYSFTGNRCILYNDYNEKVDSKVKVRTK